MEDYDVDDATLAKRTSFTRMFFSNFYKTYLNRKMVELYFNRSIRSSKSAFVTMEKKVRKNEGKEVEFQVPEVFEHILVTRH